jgi:YfiH family protein
MWRLDADAAVPMWRPAPTALDAILAFSTRRGGVSAAPYDTLNLGRSTADDPGAVAANRRSVLEALGLDPARVATVGQVHGARVIEVSAPGIHPSADALFTRAPGLALAVTTADCLPIVLTVPGAVCVAHSGWRGTAAGMPRAALEALCTASGATPADVVAHLGPAIGPCCYEIGPEVAQRFPASAVPRVGGAQHLDLRAATKAQLCDAGMRAKHVHVVPACTACEPRWYFSHRRDAGRTGRHWAVAALPPAGRRHGAAV